MKRSEYKRLGDYIEKCEGRNSQGLYGEEDVLGVNNEGNIVKSKAKLHGVDLSPYKVVKNNNFVYNPARLDLGSISLYKGEGCVVSTLYVVFKVRDDKEEELLTDYLNLWLKRKEFHRYVGYVNWGSAREYFWYDNIAEVLLPVPSIEEQHRIVSEYQTVERRIKNNEAMIQKLEETAQAIYHHTFVDGIDENNLPEGWKKGKLIDFLSIRGGGTPSTDVDSYWNNGNIPFFSPKDVTTTPFTFVTEKKITEEGLNNCNSALFAKNTIFLTARGTIGKIAIAGCPMAMNQSNFALIGKENVTQFYLYYLLKQYIEKIKGGANGAVFSAITMNEFNEEVIVASKEFIDGFTEKVGIIFNGIEYYIRETSHLRTLLSLLTSKLS